MGKVYYKLFYHVVWSTYLREPSITPAIASSLYSFLQEKAKHNRSFIHAVNGMEDHVHVVITIPPSESISSVIGKLKGSSSYYLNNISGLCRSFQWQDGFGVISVPEKGLKGVLRYVERQKEHHRSGRPTRGFERDSGDVDPTDHPEG